jgi:hypothetical protein
VNGEDQPNERKPILTIELKEDGLNFEWGKEFTDISGDFNDGEFRRALNRIILSKLKIEVDGYEPKEIALLSPVKYDKDERKGTFLDQSYKLSSQESFPLWKKEEGKEFKLSYPDDLLLLDFSELLNVADEVSIREKKFHKINDSISYAPEIPDISIGPIACRIVPDSNDNKKDKSENNLKVKIEFLSARELENLRKEKDDIEKKIVEKNKQLKEIGKGFTENKQKKLIKYHNNLQTQLQGLENELQNLNKNIPQNKNKRIDIENRIAVIKNEIPLIQRDIDELEEDLKEWKRVNGEKKDFEKNKDDKQKEIKTLLDKYKDVRIETFSIYLLKHGTKSEDVDKPENRLLLLEMK